MAINKLFYIIKHILQKEKILTVNFLNLLYGITFSFYILMINCALVVKRIW